MREMRLPTQARLTSRLVPDLQVRHGRAVGVLAALGFSAGVSHDTFNHYIKSLRKLGVPFERGEFGLSAQRPAEYSYNHLMELCVALTLRVYGTLPDPVIAGLITFRHQLYEFYRRAYIEYETGLGSAVHVTVPGRAEFGMGGVYLDLRIRFGSGRVLEFGPPRLLSPFEALCIYARLETPGRVHLPFNLSTLSIGLVEQAEGAPKMRPGARAVMA